MANRMKAEFTKLMLDNDMDKRLAEVKAADKFAEKYPRSENSILDETSVNTDNTWNAFASRTTIATRRKFWVKTIAIIVIVTTILAGLVMLGM